MILGHEWWQWFVGALLAGAGWAVGNALIAGLLGLMARKPA
jgi:hypothetical protein